MYDPCFLKRAKKREEEYSEKNKRKK